MGCFESFSADIKCPCGHVWYGNDIQSKDFDCVLDHLKQGERTDKKVRHGFFYDDSLFGNLTMYEMLNEYWSNPGKYITTFWNDGKDEYVRLDNDRGMGYTCFKGIHGMDFNCYTTCPKCNSWLELEGHIVDDVFEGVTVEYSREINK